MYAVEVCVRVCLLHTWFDHLEVRVANAESEPFIILCMETNTQLNLVGVK